MKIQFPKPRGQYAVGTFTYTIKDHRKEVLPAGGMRSIAARVYLKHTKPAPELTDNEVIKVKEYCPDL